MSGRFRPLLPSLGQNTSQGDSTPNPDADPEADSSTQTPRLRTACTECRRRKVKCDGLRPICANCTKYRLQCKYDRDADTTPITMLRRRNDDLQNQVSQLGELYEILRTRNEADAQDIFKRMRTDDSPQRVLEMIKASDLLVSPRSRTAGAATSGGQDLEALHLRASSDSAQHPPTFRWTAIAEESIVQELIEIFFAHDHPFPLGYIDKECFLSDMQAGNVHDAKYCSSALVNAICAICAFTCPSVKRYDATHGTDLRERFFTETKRLLRLPQNDGWASLPTVQAFYLVSLYETAVGMGRAELVRRCSSFVATKRHKLEVVNPMQHATPEANYKDRRAVATLVWGSFCAESLKSICYRDRSPPKTPSVPRYFEGHAQDSETTGDIDKGTGWRIYSCICDLSEALLAELARCGIQHGSVTNAYPNLDQRMRLYRQVQDSRRRILDDLRWDRRRTSHNLYLSNYFDHAAIVILRPLPWDCEIELPEGLSTSGTVCLFHCDNNLRDYEAHMSACDTVGPLMAIYAPYQPYTVALTLVSHLDDHRTHDLFTRSCRHLFHGAKTFPVASNALSSLLMVARQASQSLPRDAIPYFQNVGPGDDGIQPLVDPVLPQYLEMITSFSEDIHETGLIVGPAIAQLVAKWNNLSLEDG